MFKRLKHLHRVKVLNRFWQKENVQITESSVQLRLENLKVESPSARKSEREEVELVSKGDRQSKNIIKKLRNT